MYALTKLLIHTPAPTPSWEFFIISVTLCLLLELCDLFVQIVKSFLDGLLCSVNSSQQQTRI